MASLTGKINSMSVVAGPVASLRTRWIYSLLNNRQSRHDILQIDEAAREEIMFWRTCIQGLNGQVLWRAASAVRVVYIDARTIGYAGYVVEHGRTHRWSESEKEKSCS